MVIAEQLYTAEAFFEYAMLPENQDRRLELDDGVIVEMAASTPMNTITAARIIYFLNQFVIPNRLGVVTAPDGGFKLASRRTRQPDAAFVSFAHSPGIPDRFDFAPDLALEVVSPDEDIFRKALEYLRAGTRQVWAVYTDEQIVYVMTLNNDGTLLSRPYDIDSVLDGGDILPGFKLPVRDVLPTQTQES